jgi:tetratricopeptide (TPR) repeat protein
MLDAPRRARLVDTVNELLFLWAVALDHGGERNEALTVCDRALAFATPQGPWLALRARLLSMPWSSTGIDGRDDPAAETSALACSQWGLLRELERHRGAAIEWLKRAVSLKPDDYWHEYLLAFIQDRGRLPDEALRHYTSAVALRPESPWVRYSLARLYRGRYAWEHAKTDLNLALKAFHAEHRPEEWRTRLELGLVYQSLGDQAEARAQYERVIAADPKGDYARAARVNRAKLDVDAGAADRAMAEYHALLAEHPADASARLGRALLALRQGRAGPAESDLNVLLARPEVPDPEDPANRAEVLAQRALARLILGRAADAERDASEAFRLAPGPAHERLHARTLVALGRVDQVRLDNPDELARWPGRGPALAADLRRAADRLRAEAAGKGAAALRAALDRAVLLAALRDPDAEVEASRAVTLARLSPQPYLIRARVRRYRGAIADALSDVERGLEVAPTDPRLWELRGLLESDAGDPRAAIADFERAFQSKAGATIHAPMASALFAIGRADLSVRAWTDALSHDPEDPEAYLGRARAFFRLGKRDQAKADLEQAADWAVGRPGLGVRIVLTAARGLAGNPDQVSRVLALFRRVFPPGPR